GSVGDVPGTDGNEGVAAFGVRNEGASAAAADVLESGGTSAHADDAASESAAVNATAVVTRETPRIITNPPGQMPGSSTHWTYRGLRSAESACGNFGERTADDTA